MAGSGKGKHKKGKKHSKSRTDSVNRQPGTSNFDSNLSNVNSDTMSRIVKKSKDENPYTEFELKVDMSGWENNNEHTLELLLYNKFESLYTDALLKILSMGYDTYNARIGILMNGHWHGRKSLLRNIVDNSVEFLQSKCITDKEAPQGYKHMADRINSLKRSLIMEMQKLHRDCGKADAMKELLGISAASSTHSQLAVCSKGESSVGDSTGCTTETKACDSVPEEDLEATVPENLLSPEEFEASPAYPCDLLTSDDLDLEDSSLQLLVKTPEDPKGLLILSLVNQCRKVKEEVKERREWALEKASQADRKLNDHLSELQRLRWENLEIRKINEDAKVLLKRKLKKLREMDISLRNTLSQLEQSAANLRQLELQNAEILEEIECQRVDASKSNKTLREAEKRVRKSLKRLETMEEEKRLLQQQVEEQKQKVVQLNKKFFQLNIAQVEAEEMLEEETKEKEVAIALLAEEERLKNILEANLRRE